MMPGHLLGATGAGDVKLMAAIGAIIGPALVISAFLFSAVAGGVLAVAVALRRRRLAVTLAGTGRLIAAPTGRETGNRIGDAGQSLRLRAGHRGGKRSRSVIGMNVSNLKSSRTRRDDAHKSQKERTRSRPARNRDHHPDHPADRRLHLRVRPRLPDVAGPDQRCARGRAHRDPGRQDRCRRRERGQELHARRADCRSEPPSSTSTATWRWVPTPRRESPSTTRSSSSCSIPLSGWSRRAARPARH